MRWKEAKFVAAGGVCLGEEAGRSPCSGVARGDGGRSFRRRRKGKAARIVDKEEAARLMVFQG